MNIKEQKKREGKLFNRLLLLGRQLIIPRNGFFLRIISRMFSRFANKFRLLPVSMHKNKSQFPIYVLSKHKKGGLTMAVTYLFCNDILKSMDYKEPEKGRSTDAEIITVVLIAAQYFAGNKEKSLCFVRSIGLKPAIPGENRFNRRLHRTGELIGGLFFYMVQAVKCLNMGTTCRIDGFPVSGRQCIRMINSRIVRRKESADNRVSIPCYFYGFKVHMTVTCTGIPVEFTFSAYLPEEMLAGNEINLPAARKNNSGHPHIPRTEYLMSAGRKQVEATFSGMVRYMRPYPFMLRQTGGCLLN